MRRLSIVLVAAALLAVALPVHATSAHEKNVAFIWSTLGTQDPLQPATMPDGRVVTLAEAVEEAAARAGGVDLAALAAGAAGPLGFYIGDIWVYEYGPGSCTTTQVAPGSPIFLGPDPQFWIYAGGTGAISSPGGYITIVFAWTMKMTEVRSGTPWTLSGNTDLYCINFGGNHLAFPFGNGVFRWG